jgi:hypothetical protein
LSHAVSHWPIESHPNRPCFLVQNLRWHFVAFVGVPVFLGTIAQLCRGELARRSGNYGTSRPRLTTKIGQLCRIACISRGFSATSGHEQFLSLTICFCLPGKFSPRSHGDTEKAIYKEARNAEINHDKLIESIGCSLFLSDKSICSVSSVPPWFNPMSVAAMARYVIRGFPSVHATPTERKKRLTPANAEYDQEGRCRTPYRLSLRPAI